MPNGWRGGRGQEGAGGIADERVGKTNRVGTPGMVKERIVAYRDAGVTTRRVDPQGEGLDGRLETLGQVMELVNDV